MAVDWDNRLDQRGAVLHESQPQLGQAYWRLVTAQWLNRSEAHNLHHILVDVLDADGQRMTGVPVRFSWASGFDVRVTEAKPGEDRATDFPMYAVAPAYTVEVNDGRPSDKVAGLGLGTISAPGNAIHTSYRFVFQLDLNSFSPPEPPTPPTPPPGPDPDSLRAVRLLLASAQDHIEQASRILEKLT